LLPPLADNFSLPAGFSSPDELVESDVEKCFEDGARTRGGGCGGFAGFAVVGEALALLLPAVCVCVVLELARKRDCEWLEK